MGYMKHTYKGGSIRSLVNRENYNRKYVANIIDGFKKLVLKNLANEGPKYRGMEARDEIRTVKITIELLEGEGRRYDEFGGKNFIEYEFKHLNPNPNGQFPQFQNNEPWHSGHSIPSWAEEDFVMKKDKWKEK